MMTSRQVGELLQTCVVAVAWIVVATVGILLAVDWTARRCEAWSARRRRAGR